MARRAQSAASWLAAGLGCGSRPTAVRASATSARLLARSVAFIPASWPPPSIVSATAAEQKLAGGPGRAVLAADRDSRRPGQVDADAPARADRHIEPPGARRRHRGEAEHARLVPAALDELQGEPVAPALVVGHPGAAERREAGLWRGGTRRRCGARPARC